MRYASLLNPGGLLAAALTVVLLAGACAPAAAPTTAAPSGKVTVAFPVDFGVLDPALLTLTTEYSVTKAVNEGLVNRNAKGEYVPWLAESWKQVDDLTWEFKLRQNVKFQDGEPFNAQA